MPTTNVLAVALFAAAATIAATNPRSDAPTRANLVTNNDNRAPAGTLSGETLTLSLEAAQGDWHPYGPNGPIRHILAFGEAGKALQTPGPMIRVRVGTKIRARVRNTLKTTLVVHGLSDRRAANPDTLVVPAGESRDATFTASDEGTFFYWASSTQSSFSDRVYEDAQLNGAIIVDPRAGTPKPDRVFVIQWSQERHAAPDTSADFLHSFFTFNGAPWPGTERLSYSQGDSIRWRFINASADVHPLHLHGFYFRITGRGDANRDTLYWRAQERMGVTEMLDEGTTMNLAWYADRPGAWVFHCHLNFHVLPNIAIGADAKSDGAVIHEMFSAPNESEMAQMATMNHSEMGMGGLVMRMDIKPKGDWKPYTGARERFRLYIQSDSQPADTARRFGYALAIGNVVPPATAVKWPGPTIVLHKGTPTSITVINHIAEPSQVHWHGLELDSYFDGVAGLSSNKSSAGAHVSPMIMPRDSFEMTVTPPRAGSFMYHTHINDVRQQSHGLYGPIIVLEPGQKWDPESDLIFQSGTNPADDPILNGSTAPAPLTLHAGKSYRFRLMNITLDVPLNEIRITDDKGRAPRWTPLAKDGFDLPVHQQVSRPARQRVSIGETHDFRVEFRGPGEYTLTGRLGNGEIYATQIIHVVR